MIQGVFKHYKGGIYYVLGFATLEATLEKMVIYSDRKGVTWVRSYDEFFSLVEYKGETVPRFKQLWMGEME